MNGKNKALIAGLMAGIAAPASIGATVHYQRLAGSDMNRMRHDVERVGRDFAVVINRKNGEKTGSPAARKPA